MTQEKDYVDPIDWVYEVRRRVSEKYGHSVSRMIEAGRLAQAEAVKHGAVFNFARLPVARRRIAAAA